MASAGLTIVANVAIATGPALLGVPQSSVKSLIYFFSNFFQSKKIAVSSVAIFADLLLNLAGFPHC